MAEQLTHESKDLIVLIFRRMGDLSIKKELASLSAAPDGLVIDYLNGMWEWQGQVLPIGAAQKFPQIVGDAAVVGVYNRQSFEQLRAMVEKVYI